MTITAKTVSAALNTNNIESEIEWSYGDLGKVTCGPRLDIVIQNGNAFISDESKSRYGHHRSSLISDRTVNPLLERIEAVLKGLK